ncbi:MAG TPA: hypothetical protein VK717_10345 [Opitutaceae bacterium]|jgi:hypothetical protein|nr:hypothetical protein [Opitutaceae bacterium]
MRNSGRRILQKNPVEKAEQRDKESEEAHPAGMAKDVVVQFAQASDKPVAAGRAKTPSARELAEEGDKAKNQDDAQLGQGGIKAVSGSAAVAWVFLRRRPVCEKATT